MLKILGILCGILLFTLAGMALLIIEECIRDWFRYRKGAVNRGKGSHQRISNDDSCSSRRTNVGTSYHAWVEHATAAMMARDAHDTAVRDSRWMHDDACRTAHESHDTAMHDHQAAVDCHDQFSAPPDFGCCNPFF